jgi:hypothetical protein
MSQKIKLPWYGHVLGMHNFDSINKIGAPNTFQQKSLVPI